jgi:hypothetical protein
MDAYVCYLKEHRYCPQCASGSRENRASRGPYTKRRPATLGQSHFRPVWQAIQEQSTRYFTIELKETQVCIMRRSILAMRKYVLIALSSLGLFALAPGQARADEVYSNGTVTVYRHHSPEWYREHERLRHREWREHEWREHHRPYYPDQD